jgi:hypothetical protein
VDRNFHVLGPNLLWLGSITAHHTDEGYDAGGLARHGADLRTPVGPIHFSSSDLAGKGYQHVDGAIRVGRQTAQAIVGALLPAWPVLIVYKSGR